MSEPGPDEKTNPARELLGSIDESLQRIARALDGPADRAFRSMGLDPESQRDHTRARRESEMLRLYRLGLLVAGAAACAAIAAAVAAFLAASPAASGLPPL